MKHLLAMLFLTTALLFSTKSNAGQITNTATFTWVHTIPGGGTLNCVATVVTTTYYTTSNGVVTITGSTTVTTLTDCVHAKITSTGTANTNPAGEVLSINVTGCEVSEYEGSLDLCDITSSPDYLATVVGLMNDAFAELNQ